jgi:hypothetical protein
VTLITWPSSYKSEKKRLTGGEKPKKKLPIPEGLISFALTHLRIEI